MIRNQSCNISYLECALTARFYCLYLPLVRAVRKHQVLTLTIRGESRGRRKVR